MANCPTVNPLQAAPSIRGGDADLFEDGLAPAWMTGNILFKIA